MAEIVEPLVSVTLRQLIKPLIMLCGCAVAFGIVYLADKFVRALFGTVTGSVGWIPFVNRVVAAPIHSIEQKLTGALGSAEQAIDKQIAGYLHTLAHLPSMLGNALLQTAEALWIVAAFAATLLDPRQMRKFYESIVGKERARLVPVNAKANAADAHAKAVSQSVAHGVLPRLRVVEHEAGHVLPRAVGSLREQARHSEVEITNLWKWTRKHTLLAGTAAFAGAVALSLRRLGLEWLRCPSFSRIGRGLGCRGFGLIEDFLALGLEIVVVADICQIADVIESAAILVEPELDKLVGLDNFICRAGGASFPSGIVASDTRGRGGNPSGLIDADLAA